MSHFDQDTLRFILESAILAPSADNQHRVRFKLDQDTIRIMYAEAALPPFGGYKRALVLMSLGALVENLKIAASRFGIKAATTLYPDPNQPNWVLHIQLQADQALIDPLWQTISLRHTNRRVLFRGPKMTELERNELDATVHTYSACQLVWLDDRIVRNRSLQLMRRAESERFHTRLLHEELFSAIHFEIGWRGNCLVGLPPGALAVERPLRPLFALLRHWTVIRLANLLGLHHLLGWRSCELPCRLAPHLGLLAVKNADDQSVFDVGRVFQRIWLTATRQGRVLQPMPASAIFALEGAVGEGVPADTQQSLTDGWRSSLGEAIPLMLFRIGFAKPLPIAAGRRPVDAYLETPTG
jgi:hypothetical protein